MKNKIIVMMYLGSLVFSVLSFADDKQDANANASAADRNHEKATFDYNQGIYNDKENQDIRAKNLAEKNLKANDKDNKRIQDEQDQTKGQFIEKF